MRFFLGSIAALLALAFPIPGFAQGIDVCPLGILSCAPDLSSYIERTIVTGPRGLQVAFVGFLFAMLVFYGFRLAFEAEEEETLTQTKTAYGHAIFGAVLVTAAYVIAEGFVTYGGVERQPLEDVAFQVVAFAKGLVTALLIGNIFYQAALLIVAQDDGTRDRARKLLLYGMIAAAVVIIANSLVEAAWNRDIGIASRSAIGITNFLATIFGLTAVVAIIGSGIFLVISVEEQLKDRAKQMLKTAIISLIVIISSYVIISTFIF